MRTIDRRIGDVCDVFDGPHATPTPCDEGPIYLGISSILDDGSIDYENSKRISWEEYPKWTKRVTPQPGDVVFSYEANLDTYAIVPEDFVGCLGRRMAIMRPKRDEIVPRFLYYYMLSPQWKAVIASKTVLGATVNRIPIATYPDFPIMIPDLETQRRIADVLSAYDKLIENNRKQIKLLEEAAQRLYKEWFVDLKFPGYETTPIVNGLPEGWRYGTLNNLLDECGTRIDVHEREAFVHYLPIDSLPSKSFTCWDSRPICEAESSLLAFKENDFIFGAMRPYFHKVVVAPYAGITRSTCFVLRSKDATAVYFAYMSLFWEQTIRYATSISVGTTMPYVRWTDLKKMKLIIPRQGVQRSYSSMIASVFNEISILEKSVAVAREARDRLLPKLMSGEIEV